MYLPDPFPEGLYLWPPGVPRSDTLAGWVQAFEALGFAACADAALEAGYEKIAIFAHPGGPPSHVARQLDSGKWTSKLGTMEDIEHDLDGLVGERYGHVARLLKRPRRL